MSTIIIMKIQIATFALVPEHIFIAEKNFHSEKLILILSNENKFDDLEKINEKSREVLTKINEVKEFYSKLNVPIEEHFVDYKNFFKMTIQLSKLIISFSNKDEILLNLSGGRRLMPFALIYAGMFISNFRNFNIKCVVIPEDKSYIPFNLLSHYLPDDKDINLMSKLSSIISLTDLEKILGLKQPTISFRLKKLEQFGYIVIKGRNRVLTSLGQLVVDIYASKLKEKEKEEEVN